MAFFFIGLAAMCASGWFCCHQANAKTHLVKAKWKVKTYLNSRNSKRFGVYRKGRFTGIWWKQTELFDLDECEYYIRYLSDPEMRKFYDDKGEPIG